MTRTSLLLASALLAAGCVTTPQRSVSDLDVEIPDRWSSGDPLEGDMTSGWLRSFGQPELETVIAEALANNHDLRAAAARVEAAEAQLRIVGADRLPSVSAGFSGQRQRQVIIGLPFGVLSPTSSRLGTSIDISWEADLWGRIRAGREAAVADAQVAAANLAAARLSLATRVARSWFAVAEALRQVELAEQTVETFRRSTESVRARYDAGLRPALDLRLSRSQLAGAEALLARRLEGLERTLRQLELLVGRYPEGSIEMTSGLPPVPPALPAGLPAQLIARRPDVVAAERQLAAADARQVAARAALYPSLRLTASGGTASDELGDLLDGDFRVWSLVAGLTQPLFQGGKLRAGVDLAAANSEAALASFAQVVLAAFTEVETALAVDDLLRQRQEALETAVSESLAAQQLAEEQYRAGLVDVLSVLDAQRRALDAQSTYLDVRRARLDNRLDLLLALGGDFENGSAAQTPPLVISTAEVPHS
ncbi:MAG: efflux transporter outer membrane subunit [Acidobacteriota bacterium]|nr:MAG: efflux transporter outer membrane subunit [Acidobacteriota bacterium]